MEEREVVLEVRHLKKNYGNGPVLQDISFQLHKGEVMVFIGPSGCGKSTLLRCINGLERVQEGEILLDGRVISSDKTKWSE
ncbi:MAG: ATP-binding cassette domain-containing protein, partial [Acetatifactor sp.]